MPPFDLICILFVKAPSLGAKNVKSLASAVVEIQGGPKIQK